MPDEPSILMFDIEARTEKFGDGPPPLSATIVRLNGEAAAIGEKIEREVKKLFPPYVNVQADVRFEAGSLLMTGTVAILSWVGNAVLDALKDHAQEQLAGLMKMAVQRAMNRAMSSLGLHQSVGPMEMSVTPLRAPVRTPQPPSPAPAAAEMTYTGATALPHTISQGTTRWLAVALAIVFLTQVLLVLDRLFVVQLR